MADGLDAMTAMRTKNTSSRRALPPPRHQPRATPVPMPEPAPAQPAPESPAPRTSPAAAGATDLTKVSIYLDEATDTYLETVRATARTVRPRVDATRSAVVRMALTRLADQLNPEQVVAELQRNAATHTGPGRKRA